MKKINFENDYHKIKSLLDENKSGKHEICVWQKDEQSNKRFIRNMKVESNSLTDTKIWLKPLSNNPMKFTLGTAFYYSHDLKIVFKTEIFSIEDDLVTLTYPREATLLEENDPIPENFLLMKVHGGNEIVENDLLKVKGGIPEPINDITKVKGGMADGTSDILKVKGSKTQSLEEEKHFHALRESARVAPKDEKFVTLIKDSAPSEETIYKLFDLSQGGAGLLIFSPTEFSIGEAVSIVAIDQKPIDKILKGSVVAIRPYDEARSEFKMGIKFS